MTKKLKITVLGKTYEVLVEEIEEGAVSIPTPSVKETVKTPLYAEPKPVSEVTSPVSGTVTDIAVHIGDELHSGDRLCTVEAMKMKNSIPAPIDGVVTKILVRVGDTVESGALLITME